MRLTVLRPVEIEVDAIRLVCPVNYDDEDIPRDFPGRAKQPPATDRRDRRDRPIPRPDLLTLTIDLGTRTVRDWPIGREAACYMKVVDEGSYYLLSGDEIVASRVENYVPHCIPQEDGDYLALYIAADGTVGKCNGCGRRTEDWSPRVDEITAAFWPEE